MRQINRPFKKRLDQRRKDLRKVEDCLSHKECLLGLGGSPSFIKPPIGTGDDIIVEDEMIETVTDDGAPSGSATQESAATSPGEESAQAMDMELPPTSPVSPNKDDILSGATEVGVEAEMATLRVASTPEGQEGDDEDASR